MSESKTKGHSEKLRFGFPAFRVMIHVFQSHLQEELVVSNDLRPRSEQRGAVLKGLCERGNDEQSRICEFDCTEINIASSTGNNNVHLQTNRLPAKLRPFNPVYRSRIADKPKHPNGGKTIIPTNPVTKGAIT